MLFNKRNCCQMPQCNEFRDPQMECPIMEPVTTKCIERQFFHQVPHICPMHTHIINKHIYEHTYTPEYTCSEENQVINNDCGSCSGF